MCGALLTACTGTDSTPRASDQAHLAGTRAVACDQARAARTALDSLACLDGTASRVLHVEADSAGTRIETGPGDPSTMDGMAIVRLNRSCRIISLVQTDSA